MKRFVLCLLLLSPVVSSAQVLSEKQLDELRKSWEDPQGRKKYAFSASFVRRTISKRTDLAKIKQYVANKKVPYLITASFYEYIKDGSGFKRVTLRDTANVYVMDSDGKVIFKKTRSVCDLTGS